MGTKNIGIELKTVTILMKRKMEKEISENENITGNHGYILGFLCMKKDQNIFQKDIEQEFSIRRSTATVILNIMEKNDLIKRVNCKNDARLKKVVLTEKGLNLCEQSYNKIQQFEQKLKNNLSKQELENFFCTLEKIKNNINNI